MTKPFMPDIANMPLSTPMGTLDWVGMSQIEMPIMLAQAGVEPVRSLARVQAYVNLIDPQSKGIHMSRLYLMLDKASTQAVTPASVSAMLSEFVQSHTGLSNAAFVEYKFDYYERRGSLLSGNSGWKNYPCLIRGHLQEGDLRLELQVEVPYSSTCPCSAALARQLIQEQFSSDFTGREQLSQAEVYAWLGTSQGICATPHSQRSFAKVRVTLSNTQMESFEVSQLINRIEDALQTAVQAAVKREDEQEFARLNGANLMFCEDAARRLQAQLDAQSDYSDFWLRVDHLESLHPHDAVSIVSKGVAGGYQPLPSLGG
ncbi:MAG: GTP cyclohydrolase I FolE2 [Thiotrichales bacterium 32-46-8]|nr:MAG: GTP cyclohydrolase I FolE2 [Thiotrichales bacterium 32-46-8]OYY23799.1 MAG: GTP cyclohydrolase I FolE2 [Thiotrichales bacterium 35-46-9]OZA75375.1 MAG: GTP cyclohydrolase I FolE2 [Thiotrichales bacterium 39-47-5]OZA96253.1 MAG: GTP cyclohydrolase I FolE2 [Thiotrichales bacterium 34-46-19]HQR96173.1 GTP cyclohydrolase FolE2 [Thiotrichales bacterium]